MQPASDPIYSTLSAWQLRRRQQIALAQLPYAFSVGVGVGGSAYVLITTLGHKHAEWVALLFALSSLMIYSLWGYRKTRATPHALAKQIDAHFGLQDRLATALDALDARISPSTLTPYLLEDARVHAQHLHIQQALPLQWHPKRWGVFLGSIIIVGAFVLWRVITPLPLSESPTAETVQTALSSAQNTLKETIQTLAVDNTLNSETRQALIQALQTRLDTLSQPEVTAESVFARLNDAEAQLRQASQTAQASLQQDDETLLNALGAPLTQSPEEALQQALENATTPENRQALAETLSQVASSSQNSARAESLQQASNALAENNLDSAQQALEQSEQARDAQDALRESLSESAQTLQAQAQEVAQADQAQTPSNSTQGQSSETAQQAQSEQSTASDSASSAQEGQTAGNQAGSIPQEGASPSDTQSEGQSAQGNTPSENGSPQPSDSASSGQETPPDAQQSAQTDQQPANGNAGNASGESASADGIGERAFESVYAPLNFEPDSSTDLILEADSSDSPQRPSNQDSVIPADSPLVPYNRVFEQYAQQASQALSRDYVPLGLRDVIRTYFEGLTP